MRARSASLARAALLAACALPACATQPESAGGKDNLPNAGAGPFRALETEELGNLRSGPNAFEDTDNFGRDIAVLDLDGDPATFEIAGYLAVAIEEGDEEPKADAPTRAILRYGALDGRSFDRAADPVLTADQAWEGGVIGAPAVLQVGDELFLYYAAAGGIGLARGLASDGLTFAKEPGPVLAPDAGGWEKGSPVKSPGVVRLDDGSFRMFYEVAITETRSLLGEARSGDGVSWQRLGDAPALGFGTVDADAGDIPYDGSGVGSPFPILATSADDRRILRVYYGARDDQGRRTIGLAARYGDDGPLQRAVSPVFGTTKPLDPSEPCVVVFAGFTLLFATEQATTTQKHPAVAVAVAPATAALPPPNPK